ncbi:MAG TPA: tyrosine--tRNA ligase [Vicinamibacterales bacterium]|nr:tyrosine--tRNA ligase [Vicinamibacterales bacterium]
MTLFEEFQWRDMVYDATEGAQDMLAKEQVTCYIGFDPTASSLHVGSLLPIMALARLQRFGHSPIALVGGGTGMIGDPSGKSQERTLLTIEEIDHNARGMRAQLERFLDFNATPNAARMVNNADWLRTIGLLEFLRDTGKHFTVNYMMAKESVKRRLDDGLSFTEFSYQLLQAHDYLHLHRTYGCTLQMGGSDQWGNIVAGADLVRKVAQGKAHGLVMPLVTTSAGAKFGKTEAGTVWLDPQRTSPFKFYQFWLNTDDRDVVKYLKYFTWLDQPIIGALEKTVQDAPETREAQRTLARELTTMVHGAAATAAAERAADVLFGGSLKDASADDILEVFADAPSVTMSVSELEALSAAALVARVGLAASNGEASRVIQQGGIYLNDQRVTDGRARISASQAIGNKVIVLRKGSRERRVVRLA